MNHFRRFACLLACLAFPASALADTMDRYVWATKLIIRTEPDAKSPETGRLPLGAKVRLLPSEAPPIKYQAALTTLVSQSANMQANTLMVDGTWQRVQSGSLQGWVFDGFLSRYPLAVNTGNPEKLDTINTYLERQFQIRHERHWKAGDGFKTATYREMRRDPDLHDFIDDATLIRWRKADLAQGGELEEMEIGGGDYAGWERKERVNNVPLSFNESLLLLSRFGVFGDNMYVAEYAPEQGRLKLGTIEDTRGALEFNLECSKGVCNMVFDIATE